LLGGERFNPVGGTDSHRETGIPFSQAGLGCDRCREPDIEEGAFTGTTRGVRKRRLRGVGLVAHPSGDLHHCCPGRGEAIMIATTGFESPTMSKVFPNRCVAGRELAALLASKRLPNPIVLALPRGGVPVGYEVAHALGIPLDVLVVRKVGAPQQPELAIGAVGHGATVLDEETIAMLGVPQEYIQAAVGRERLDVERRTALFRAGLPPLELKGKTAVLVDDGLATGATAEAAVDVARHLGAEQVVVAVPVASVEAVKRLSAKADAVISLATPPFFRAVGYWYEDFAATEDEEVQRLLKVARLEREAGYRPA